MYSARSQRRLSQFCKVLPKSLPSKRTKSALIAQNCSLTTKKGRVLTQGAQEKHRCTHMVRPPIDLNALIQRLVGDAEAVLLGDAQGALVAQFGCEDLLGSALSDDHPSEASSPVDLVRHLLPEDQITFSQSYHDVHSGTSERIEMRARTRHMDGSRTIVDICLESIFDGDDRLVFARVRRAEAEATIDVVASNDSDQGEVDRLALRSLAQDWSQRLALCVRSSLSVEIGNCLIALATPIAAVGATLTMSGPHGRGREWRWVAGNLVSVTNVENQRPFVFHALVGNETRVGDPVITRGESGTTVTISELWGNGMLTELTLNMGPTLRTHTFATRSTLNMGPTLRTHTFATRSSLNMGPTLRTHTFASRSSLDLGPNLQTRSSLPSSSVSVPIEIPHELSAIVHVFQSPLARIAGDAIATAERVRAEMIFQQLSDLVVVWSSDGTISFATPSFTRLIGAELGIGEAVKFDDLVIDAETVFAGFRDLTEGQTSHVTRLTVRAYDQLTQTVVKRTIEVVTTNLLTDVYVGGYVTTGRDVTDTLEAAERQARKDGLAQVVASISSRFVNGPKGATYAGIRKALGDVAEYCGVERALVWQKQTNGALFVTHEYTAGDIVPLGSSVPMIAEHNVSELLPYALDGQVELCLHAGHGQQFVSAVEATRKGGLGAILVVGMRNSDGLIGLLTFSASRHADGSIPALQTLRSSDTQAALRTVGELVTNVLTHSAAQEALTYNATHDSLTGLANRRLLLERADRMLSSARRRGNGIGLLFLDIDDFKVINDTLGHDFGDELLRDAGNRLRRIAVGSTVVARLGGDEFILLIEAQHPQDAVAQLARQIALELERPFELGDREVALKISIGAVTVDADAQQLPTPGDLVRRADMAMYAAKHRGGNTFELFSTEMEEQAQRRFNLHDELRVALLSNQLELWYQPQVCLRTGRFVGCEALVRWRHPSKGFILPAEFIGAAEQAGLIKDLGIWVFTRAAETLAELRFEGLIDDRFELAVNVSPLQLIDSSLVDTFTEIASRFNVPNSQLKIELTESTLAERDRVIPNLVALRAAGFQTSIDDFGTGYSSLSYLRDLPLNELKIDRSFVMSIDQEERDLNMVSALVDMAHSLGLIVVAEGVETEGQRDQLKRMGCNVGQGWLFSKALPLHELSALLDMSHEHVG
jgi:diguanylate cyclase (GGDEF)-like protein